MCDLIDLNSPDPKKLRGISKLASPLIPGPQTPGENINSIDLISHERRTSVENNPFDKVFKETAEYAAKKDDPFEAVLEKARQNSSGDLARGYKYNDDFTPKKKRYSDILRMNKTMEEPLLQEILNKNFHRSRYQDAEENNVNDFHSDNNKGKESTSIRSRIMNILNPPSILICPPSPSNTSVLNQSAMNDSLLEINLTSGRTVKTERLDDEVSNDFENEEKILANGISCSDIEIKLMNPLKHRRSLSQGTKTFPESLETETESKFRSRSKSIADNVRTSNLLNKPSVSSISSVEISSNDVVNNAFLETGSTTASESFDISRISATPKLSCGSSSSLYSFGSRNRAFLCDGQSSSKIYGSSPSATSSLNLSSTSRSTGTGNILVKTPLETSVGISDLELRFEKLKLKSIGSIGRLPVYSLNHKVHSFLKSDGSELENERFENALREKEAKLIDTSDDCCVQGNDENSNCSSDSVFIETNKVDQSIFQEAKLLAQTFDELAHRSASNSFSSGEDLLYSRPQWNFDILPVSDDEAMVDNLIELPVSPMRNESEVPSDRNENEQKIANSKLVESKVSEQIKNLETEFIDQDDIRNKRMAATLLLDLEKIVQRENNPEAIALLENLEKVLGVKYENNTQLLTTLLQGTNNLSKSPKKYIDKLVLRENIRHESLEKSDEDNNEDSEILRSVKILNTPTENMRINLNVENAINKTEKAVIVNLPSATEDNKENILDKSNNVPNSIENQEKRMQVDETEALELITNLSRILGGPHNDSSPLSLLTNLRKVLNLATNQLNFENSQITKSCQHQDSANVIHTKTTEVSQQKPPAKAKPDPIKIERKKSIDSLTKVQRSGPNLTKRSMSFSGAQPTFVPTPTMTKEKTKPHPKIFKKALSYDAVPKPVLDKLGKSSTVVAEVGRNRASTIGGSGKYKLKKKSESDGIAGKKGPLKAIVPVGKMQRRGSISKKVTSMSLSRTPPKSSSAALSNFQSATSSTPNQTVALISSKKSPNTKPVASSTPDGGVSKARKLRLQFSNNNTKPKFSCNISPVTPLPTHSITESVNSKSFPMNQRHNKTLSPPKRRNSQEALMLNTTESSIPKYSPMSIFSRRNSKESFKSLENSGSPKTSKTKSHATKKSPFFQGKSESQIPQSPLKTVNNQNSKFKPFNLISKLRRGSSGSIVSDKENCA